MCWLMRGAQKYYRSERVYTDVTLNVLCVAACVVTGFQIRLYRQRVVDVFQQNRLELCGGDFSCGVLKMQHIKFKMKWRVGMRGGVKITVRCRTALWAVMAPALLWGKRFLFPSGPLIFKNACCSFTAMCFGQKLPLSVIKPTNKLNRLERCRLTVPYWL